MNPTGTYLAMFIGDRNSAKSASFFALAEDERRKREREGMTAWQAWSREHQANIISMGGPLGKTKKVSTDGVAEASNHLGAFTVVKADSIEAAAKMFENHPHFAIFPGDAVEVMPILTIPGA